MFFKEKKTSSRGLNIIIVGCGKVGNTLTELLTNEGHDVTLIDKSPERLALLTDKYDVMGLVGNGASYNVLKEAGIENADLLVAVTDLDELNLLCCTVAKRVGNCAAIARVRTPDYSDEVHYLKDKLGLAMIINPDEEAARSIAHTLNFPAALSVNAFAHGLVDMIRFKVPKGSMLTGLKLMDIGKNITRDILICSVERGSEVFIPKGDFQIEEGDIISFISDMESGNDFFAKIGFDTKQVRSTMIVGGGRSAFYLCKHLLANGVRVKVIENNQKRCEDLSELLPKATVIWGDGTNESLLKEEGIEDAEAFVSLTGIDEENILLSLHASQVSDAKTITKINRNTFHNVYNQLDVGSIVYPRQLTAELIIAYVRGLKASIDSNNVETLYHLFNNRVEAVEFKVREKSVITDVPLKELKLKKDLLIACIDHGGQIIIPGGMTEIKMGDRVVIVTKHLGLQNLEDILA